MSGTVADIVLGAAVRRVKDSGVLEGQALMATVSTVNGDGTVDVARGDSAFPRVRCLSGYPSPAVGDTVEILRTAGGWVCLGVLVTWDTGWRYPAVSSPLTNHLNNFQAVRYRRTASGVEVQGLVDTNGATGSPTVCTLEPDCAPKDHLAFPAAGNSGSCQMWVLSSGEIRFNGVPSSASYVSVSCAYSM